MVHSERKHYILNPDVHGAFVDRLRLRLSESSHPRVAYLADHVFSKFASPDANSAKARREAGIMKFLRVEQRNYRSNLRLYEQLWEDFHVGNTTMAGVLARAREIVTYVIGNTVPTHLLVGEFSGGASTSKRRGPAMVARKFAGQQDVTHSAWDLVWPSIIEDKLWPTLNPEVLHPRFVEGSVLFTVPKSDVIDRVACKEPDLNMYMQKATGNFIRSRLRKRVGIDLNDQTVNQSLARVAWGSGLATIDLSSASDSISTQLVVRLLPTEWYAWLDGLRCKRIRIDDLWHEVEMFSSMGNGFTFELESLLFYALSVASIEAKHGIRLRLSHKPPTERDGKRTISIYGDDIVVHKSVFPILRVVLSYAGFIVNSKKSHVSGPIRESCGKHYYRGLDVTPFYVRRPINHVSELILILNRIRKWSCQDRSFGDDFLYDIWRDFSRLVPRKFHGGFDVEVRDCLASPSGPAFRLLPKKVRHRGIPLGDYLSWQRDASNRKEGGCSFAVVTERPSGHLVETKHWVVRPAVPCWGAVCPQFSSEIADY